MAGLWVWVRDDVPSPRRLRRGGGRSGSCALPNPSCPVCTGVHGLSDLSGVLRSGGQGGVALHKGDEFIAFGDQNFLIVFLRNDRSPPGRWGGLAQGLGI